MLAYMSERSMMRFYWEMRNAVNIVQALVYRPSREEIENLTYSMFDLFLADKGPDYPFSCAF